MDTDKKHSLSLSRHELMILNNALNEALHGVSFSDEELKTRLGAPRAEIIKLLRHVQEALKS